VTDRAQQPALPPGHAGKASDIEELTDRYFTRPLGSVVATAAAVLGMTPTQVTIVGAIAGIAGGALLYDERLGWLAFALLFVHAILDSADGQLARRTGQTSELGRVLDGVGGYVTHIAMYIAVAAGYIDRGGSTSIVFWMLAAGISTIAHAQAYDYYRTAYSSVVKEGRVRQNETAEVSGWLQAPYQAYSAMQRLLVGSHETVLAALSARTSGGIISEAEQQRYRESFRPLVRGWNLMGDNTRRYAVGLLVCLHHIDLLFAFIAVVLNVVFIVMRLQQARADRRFLAGA
jgi:phosphatidylglycerophosphate synthase